MRRIVAAEYLSLDVVMEDTGHPAQRVRVPHDIC